MRAQVKPFTADRLHARPCRRALRICSAVGASSPPASVVATHHTLPDGKKLELLVQKAAAGSSGASKRPPLLYVHGSYHAAWCWQENFMPYFSARGYDTFAVSLRAQGGSDPAAPGAAVAGTLDLHAADLASLVPVVQTYGRDGGSPGPAPVVVGHSFGGLIVQKYILGSAAPAAYPALSGAAFLCSVPQTGNKKMVMRFLLRDPLASLKLTWGFVARSFASSTRACQELFFSPDIPADKLERYQKLLATASPIRLLDLKDMNAQVPLPPPPRNAPPAFVLGGRDDAVVDPEAVQELAAYYGTEPVVLPGMAHDCMLDTRWQEAAARLEGWLEGLAA